jgi:hypothetical protein
MPKRLYVLPFPAMTAFPAFLRLRPGQRLIRTGIF